MRAEKEAEESLFSDKLRPTYSSSKKKQLTIMTELRDLYPPLEPYFTGFLSVSDIHSLYYEESGNPQGSPGSVFVVV